MFNDSAQQISAMNKVKKIISEFNFTGKVFPLSQGFYVLKVFPLSQGFHVLKSVSTLTRFLCFKTFYSPNFQGLPMFAGKARSLPLRGVSEMFFTLVGSGLPECHRIIVREP